jgi:hypothetical protein
VIPLPGLTPPHFCAYTKPEPGFPTWLTDIDFSNASLDSYERLYYAIMITLKRKQNVNCNKFDYIRNIVIVFLLTYLTIGGETIKTVGTSNTPYTMASNKDGCIFWTTWDNDEVHYVEPSGTERFFFSSPDLQDPVGVSCDSVNCNKFDYIRNIVIVFLLSITIISDLDGLIAIPEGTLSPLVDFSTMKCIMLNRLGPKDFFSVVLICKIQ